MPAELTSAIREGRPVTDPRLGPLIVFTTVFLEGRGRPTAEQAAAFLGAGYTEIQILAVLLAIGVKTLSNYANHLFHTSVDSAFAGHQWTAP